MKTRLIASDFAHWPKCPTCMHPVALMTGGQPAQLNFPPSAESIKRFDWLCAMCSTVVRKAQ